MLKLVLKVSTFGLDASTKASAPLLDCLVNNTLVKFVPDSLDTLAQLIDIVDLHLIHLLLNYRPQFIIHRIQIRTVGRPECWRDKSWYFSRKKVNCRPRTMSWRVVLLKDKEFGNVTHVWKQFFL